MPCINTDFVPTESYRGRITYSNEPPTCLLPGELEEAAYPLVYHAMVDREGHQKTFRLNIVDLLGDRRSERIAAFAGLYSLGMEDMIIDTSFSQQMHKVAPTQPDIVLATYRSATPVLAAVEGYYDEKKQRRPHLDVVDVSRENRLYGPYSVLSHTEQRKKSEHEADRLREIVEGKRVAIVDEYYERGGALWAAGDVAARAGAISVLGVIGRWYRKIPIELSRTGKDDIYAAHRDFMHDVGRASAQTPIHDKPYQPAAYYAEMYGPSFNP
jgi:hypothetical protein